MIADTTFVSDLINEQRRYVRGPASAVLYRSRAATIRLTIITAGEISIVFSNSTAARAWLDGWQIYPLHMGIVDEAADIDRELIRRGRRLGENDNWIAGFARYYREPLISRDKAFDLVPNLRRLDY
jgi:predicted nucleic acid-binding protein